MELMAELQKIKKERVAEAAKLVSWLMAFKLYVPRKIYYEMKQIFC